MECFVCREVIFNYFWSHLYPPNSDLSRLTSPMVHIMTTVALVFSAMFIALTTCDLGFMLELTVYHLNKGGFAATALAFIMPAMCYLKLSSGALWSWKKAQCIGLIVFGVLVMILSTILSISKFLNAEEMVC